jgi:tetratricopeptide (TPR) repeat protein
MRRWSSIVTKQVILTSLILFTLSGLALAATPRDEGGMSRDVAASFVRDGEKYLESGRPEDAIRAFKIALNFDPNLAQAKAGLQRAEAMGSARPAAKTAEAPATPKVVKEPEAKVVPQAAPAPAAPEAPARVDQEVDQAFEEAMHEVRGMMRPQSRILSQGSRRPLGIPSGNNRSTSDDTISRDSFRTTVDAEEVQQIQAKLLRKISVRFEDEGFEQAIDYIREASGVNIMIDPAVLPTTQPVRRFVATNMSITHVLNHLMRYQKGLDYRVRDGAVYISNSAGLAEKAVTVLHYIADLTIPIKSRSSGSLPGGLLSDSPRVRADRKDNLYGGLTPLRGEEAEVEERDREGQRWAEFIRQNVRPSTWGNGDTNVVGAHSIQYRDGKLIVNQTPEVQDQIRDLLASFRRARTVQVAIIARFIEISEDFLESFGVDMSIKSGRDGSARQFNMTTENDPNVSLTALGGADGNGGLSLNASFLGTTDVTAIISAVRKERRGNILTAPRITCFNTQQARVTIARSRSYIQSYDSSGYPEVGELTSGIELVVQPFVSADRRYITLNLYPTVNKDDDIRTFTYSQGTTTIPDPGDPGSTIVVEDQREIQLPDSSQRVVRTTVSVPDGGTLLIGGLAEANETDGTATTPILGDIPLIKHLFRSKRKLDTRRNLIVLVTAHIIEQDKED